MPKFIITALVGTKYRKTIEATSRKHAQRLADTEIEQDSPGEEFGWVEVEVDTWVEVEKHPTK